MLQKTGVASDEEVIENVPLLGARLQPLEALALSRLCGVYVMHTWIMASS